MRRAQVESKSEKHFDPMTQAKPIFTARLELVPATIELTRAAIENVAALGARLRATVPATWPHEYLDAAAFRFVLDRLGAAPEDAAWFFYFIVLARADADRILIGTAGYKGPPSQDGMVEVGYGIVSDHRRQGYASEAVRGLLARAFAVPALKTVTAETFPELTASIGVLRTCGFRLLGAGSEPGVIRFEITRAEFGAHFPGTQQRYTTQSPECEES